jgi:hypothetical protein
VLFQTYHLASGVPLIAIGLRNAMSKAKLSPTQIFIRVVRGIVIGIGLVIVVIYAIALMPHHHEPGDTAIKKDVKDLVTLALVNSVADSAPWYPTHPEQSEPLLICNGKEGEGTKVNVWGQASSVRMAFTPKCSDNSLVYFQDMGTGFRASGIRINGAAVYYVGSTDGRVERSPCASTPCTYADALSVLNSIKMAQKDREVPRLPTASSSARK